MGGVEAALGGSVAALVNERGYRRADSTLWRAHGTDSTRYIAGMVEQDLDTGATTGYRSLYGFGGTAVAVVDHTADTVVYPMGDHLGSVVACLTTPPTPSHGALRPVGGKNAAGREPSPPITATPARSPTTTSDPRGFGVCCTINARYYDPTLGAFTQPDTIIPNPASPASFNRYAYVTNNPIKYTDPSGHNPAVAACALSASGGPVSAGLVCGGAAILVGGLAVLAVIGAVGSSGPSIDDLKDAVRRRKDAAVSALAADIAASTTLDPADQALILYAKPVDNFKEHLSDEDLDAARREAEGEVVSRRPRDDAPYDHQTEVRQAQNGLLRRIREAQSRLGRVDADEAQYWLDELSKGSRLLDHSEGFLPRGSR